MPREKKVLVKNLDGGYILAIATGYILVIVKGETELTEDDEHIEIYNYEEYYHSLEEVKRDLG